MFSLVFDLKPGKLVEKRNVYFLLRCWQTRVAEACLYRCVSQALSLFVIIWATCLTPTSWKINDTILIDMNKGAETDILSYRPIGLANTLYKLWAWMITNTLYDYAGAHSLLSSTQAGLRNQKDTIHQLQNVIMSLEDAKIFMH